jgi:hypothetical protein
LLAGPEHGRTIPLADIGSPPYSPLSSSHTVAQEPLQRRVNVLSFDGFPAN